jgi:hypothetical protein
MSNCRSGWPLSRSSSFELALIRWTSQQVRIFAYFNNLTLMAAFLSMGLGVAIGERRAALQHWTPVANHALDAPRSLGAFHIVYLPFPDLSISLWAEAVRDQSAARAVIFALIVAVFMCAGSIVGQLFTKLPALEATPHRIAGRRHRDDDHRGHFTSDLVCGGDDPVTRFLAAASDDRQLRGGSRARLDPGR